MSRRLNRWRWRLARLIAPSAIVSDPFPEKTKVAYVTMRDRGAVATWELDSFEMETTIAPPVFPPKDNVFDGTYQGRPHPVVRFSGTAGAER